MKKVLLTASLLLLSFSTQAIKVKTSATALTMCKAEAALAHPNQTKIAMKKIKQTRGIFKVTLKVSTPKGKVSTLCVIDKEGKITYSKI